MKRSPSTACHGGRGQSSSKSSPFFVDPRPVEAGQAEASHRYCETSTWKLRTLPGGRLSIIWSSTVLPFNGCLERTRASQGSSAKGNDQVITSLFVVDTL